MWGVGLTPQVSLRHEEGLKKSGDLTSQEEAMMRRR